MTNINKLETIEKNERLKELRAKLVEIIKEKTEKLIQMALDNRLAEIEYAVLKEEVKHAIYALEVAVLANDDRIKSVYNSTTSGSIYNAIHKYFHGVDLLEKTVK